MCPICTTAGEPEGSERAPAGKPPRKGIAAAAEQPPASKPLKKGAPSTTEPPAELPSERVTRATKPLVVGGKAEVVPAINTQAKPSSGKPVKGKAQQKEGTAAAPAGGYCFSFQRADKQCQ